MPEKMSTIEAHNAQKIPLERMEANFEHSKVELKNKMKALYGKNENYTKRVDDFLKKYEDKINKLKQAGESETTEGDLSDFAAEAQLILAEYE